MTNQQLKAHCEDVIANPQDHLDWVVDMAKALLPCLNAKPKAWFTDDAENDRSATTYDPKMADRWRKKPWFVGELFTAPPVPELKPIELPVGYFDAYSSPAEQVISKSEVLEAIRDAGYEVKS